MKKIIPILSAVCAALIAGAGVLGYFAYSWINPPAEPAVTPQRAGDVRGKVLTDSGAMTVAGIIVEDQQGNTSRYTTNAWGGYELSLLPGDYTLTFTKGYEYDTVTKQISVQQDKTYYMTDVRLMQLYDSYSKNWIAGDLHQHTYYSDGSDSVFSCDAAAHYECSICGAYFADEAAAQPIAEEEIFTPKVFSLTDAAITDTATSNQTMHVYALNGEEKLELAVTERSFVLRVFLGWEGAQVANLLQGVGCRVNLNIDTADNIANGRWMAFRIGCNTQGCYAYFSDTKEIFFTELEGGGKLSNAMLNNAGLYVTIVRNGGLYTAYAEDIDGNFIQIAETYSFTDSDLVKCTLGVHQGYYASEEHPAVLKDGVLVIGTTDPSAAKL